MPHYRRLPFQRQSRERRSLHVPGRGVAVNQRSSGGSFQNKDAARLGRENAFLAGEEKDARAELKRERAAAREAAAVAGGAVCLDSSAGVGGGEPQLVEKDHSDDV